MALHASSGLSIAIFSILATVWVTAMPIVQAGANTLRRNFYGPGGSEAFFETFLDDHDTKKSRNEDLGDDRATRVHPSSWLGQARSDIDFPPILLVDTNEPPIPSRSTGLLSNDRALLARFVKRNIDEIDRTPFDNFFKRNIDEIDRVGWNGFAKRFTDYLTANRMNVLKRRG